LGPKVNPVTNVPDVPDVKVAMKYIAKIVV
jgi:hypothetical protein